MKKNFCFLFLILFCTHLFAQHQPLTFQSITPEKGFTAPLIRGVIQDKEGFLWFGAMNGVYRYE